MLDKIKIGILRRQRQVGQMDDYRGGEWDYPSNEELFQQYAVATRFDDKETVFVKRILQVALPEELRGIIRRFWRVSFT